MRRVRSSPWWDDELAECWEGVKTVEKTLKFFKTSREKTRKHTQFREARQKFDKLFRKKKRTFQREKALCIDAASTSNPTDFWDQIKKLGPRRDDNQTLEVYTSDGEVSRDLGVVIETWKNSYEKLYNPKNTSSLDENYLEKCELLKSLEGEEVNDLSEWYNSRMTRHEIKKVGGKSKTKKAVGGESLPYEVFKNEASEEILEALFNKIFETNLVPTIWLKFLIKPIPKGGDTDPRVPLEYRGISLLSTVGKLYSSILNDRISEHLEKNNILEDEQNGFRKKRSCLEHIYVLSTIIKIRKAKKLSTFVSFVDFQKAFDTVDRNLLLLKIYQAGIKGNVYKSIRALYADNQCAILLKHFVTPWFPSTMGIRQGDSLSPTLFAIFINDLAKNIKEKFKGVQLGDGVNCPILLYADDIVLLAEKAVHLKAMIKMVEKWCMEWKLEVNVKKTKVVHFRPKSKAITTASFPYGGRNIEIVSSYKYLGVIFDEFLEFDEGVKALAGAGGRGLGKIFATHKRLHGMGFNTFTQLFENMVDPIILYGAGVWGLKRFGCTEAVQNRAQRMFLGVHKYACNEAVNGDMGWRTISSKQKIWVLRLWNHLCAMDESRLCKKVFNIDHKSKQGGSKS